MNVLKTTVKKSKFDALMGVLIDQQKQIDELRRSLREAVEAEVARNLGDKIHQIESTLTDTMVQRRIFIEKGYITRDEINAKYEELKKGN